MAAQPTDSEKARQAAAAAVNSTDTDDTTKKTTGTPMAQHPAATRPARRGAATDNRIIKFRIEHTQVGAHMQGAEVTQEELGVDDKGLERLLDLEAVTPVLVDPTADEDDATEEE